MAKSLLLQNVKNKIPFFKNVSTNFIFLAALFILSIIIYYMYNKHSLEHMDNNIVEGARNRGGGGGGGASGLSRLNTLVNGRPRLRF